MTKSTSRKLIIDRTSAQDQIRENVLVLFRPLIGGFTPVAVWWISHYEVSHNPVLWLLVAGGLTYSAWTVYDAVRYASRGNQWKAIGFTLMMEGVLTFTCGWLSLVALTYLIFLNGLATGTKFKGE